VRNRVNYGCPPVTLYSCRICVTFVQLRPVASWRFLRSVWAGEKMDRQTEGGARKLQDGRHGPALKLSGARQRRLSAAGPIEVRPFRVPQRDLHFSRWNRKRGPRCALSYSAWRNERWAICVKVIPFNPRLRPTSTHFIAIAHSPLSPNSTLKF
jgi:hypothetical protein